MFATALHKREFAMKVVLAAVLALLVLVGITASVSALEYKDHSYPPYHPWIAS
jgi:hypothetical protein